MAERPQGFARRMMAQQLASDARADPFSDSRFFSGKIRPSLADMENPTRFEDIKMPAYQASATGSLFLPGAGIADYFGKAPDPANPGQLLPGFSDNVQQGKYIDAVMQTGGAAGDVAMAAGALFPPAFPAAAALSTALKAPRAGRLASGIDNAVDATRGDPNQVAGSAMDAAQARYFETGKFEPPTADNPVSIMPPTETEPGIIAFHGSGADFDEFRLEMIGTGEGAQAYGYGLYFTDSEDIAKFYRDSLARGRSSIVYDGSGVKNARETDSLTDREMILDSIATEMAFFDQKPENIIKKKIKNLKQKIDDPVDISASAGDVEAQELANLVSQSARRELEIYENLDPSKFTRGKTYKVGLAPKPDELLDYDAPIGNQSPDIKAKISELIDNEITPDDLENFGSPRGDLKASLLSENRTVVSFLNDFAAIRGKDNAGEELLAKYGIPGIKYATNDTRSKQFILKLDVRGKPYDIGTEPIYARNLDDAKRIEAGYKEKGFGVQIEDIRKSNYVIFDDKAVKILEKYGIVGPVAITAGVAGAARSGNDNDDGGSILPDAGVM